MIDQILQSRCRQSSPGGEEVVYGQEDEPSGQGVRNQKALEEPHLRAYECCQQ